MQPASAGAEDEGELMRNPLGWHEPACPGLDPGAPSRRLSSAPTTPGPIILSLSKDGVQFHPELKSKPFEPHPLFASFIEAAVKQSRLV